MSGYRERKGGRERERERKIQAQTGWGRERKIVAQTGVGERERYGGKERKIETQAGVQERQKWERERNNNRIIGRGVQN